MRCLAIYLPCLNNPLRKGDLFDIWDENLRLKHVNLN